MSRRTGALLAALAVLALVMVGEWALLRSLYGRSPQATVEVQATNGGAALAAEQVRVVVYPSGRPWDLVAEGRAGEPLPLPPGRYDLRLLLVGSADHQSRWLRDVALGPGDALVREAAFSAGELGVVRAGSGPGELVVYVFAHGERDQLVTSFRPPRTALLEAGRYDLRAVLSEASEERGVIWLEDVAVETGQQAVRELHFRRGQLRVDAHNAGQALAPEAATLTVYVAGDEQEEVVDEGRAGVPLSLEAGRYDVRVAFALSNDRPERWLRGLEVREDELLAERVAFTSGRVQVDAELAGGERLGDFDAYVYYYREGDHREPVAYTPAGETAVLESGRYDVRVHFFRSHDRPDLWLRAVRVEPGEHARHTATFASGRLLVRAWEAGRGELIGDDVFLYVHEAGSGGTRPLVVARTGEELVLSAGRYDLRLVDTRAPGEGAWLRDVAVEPGARRELSPSAKELAGARAAR